MTRTAILCSGQGGQGRDMFALLADAPQAEPVFAAAKERLGGIDPRDLVRQQSDAAIHADRIGQILCCTQAMAAWSIMENIIAPPLLVAGYSVGELASWGVAGVMSPDQILDLAVARATAMDEATLEPSGLAAIRGLSRATLEPLCAAHGAFIAIINAADQLLVGGTHAALMALLPEAERAGALHCTMLPVAVASHTPLLASASAIFRQKLRDAKLGGRLRPDIRLLSGIDGMTVFSVSDGLDKLALQIRQTVDWQGCMESCRAAGVSKIIELGPGAALARLIREPIPAGDIHSLAEFHSRDGFLRWVAR